MRMLRGLLGALIWLVAGVLGLVGVLLCITLILLPVGLLVLRLSRKLFGRSVRLMLPSRVAHPVKHAGKKSRGATSKMDKKLKKSRQKGRKATPATPEIVQKATKKGRRFARKQRKRLAAVS